MALENSVPDTLNTNFGEKSWKYFFGAIAFGGYPVPFCQLCIGNGRNGHFSVLSENIFPSEWQTREKPESYSLHIFSGQLQPRITEEFVGLFPFWQLCIWKKKKSQFRDTFLKKFSEALCYLMNPFPSGSYVAPNADFPNFAQVFVKNSIKKSPQPGNPRWGVMLCLLFTFYHGMRNCRPSSSAGFFWMPCNHPR